MTKKDLGPVNAGFHQKAAKDAQKKANQTSNPDRKKSLENLAKEHQAVVDKVKREKGSGA